MGKCFKLAVSGITAWQVHKMKNQLLEDVQLEEARGNVEKAERALKDAEKFAVATSEKLEDKEDIMTKARTEQEIFGCEAQVMKWQNKLEAAQQAQKEAESALAEAKTALVDFEKELAEKRAAREEKLDEIDKHAKSGNHQHKGEHAHEVAEEKVGFDGKAEQLTNSVSDGVAKIGAAVLEMISSKMILMMLLTLICYVLLQVPGVEGVQQQYGITMLYEYRHDISPAVMQYRRGSPIGSHWDRYSGLMYLKVDGVDYNSGIDTHNVDSYHWENMAYFTPDIEGYVEPDACSVAWHNTKQLKGSTCTSYAIFSQYGRTRDQAIQNIGFMFILLIIMVVGLTLIAIDFSKLLGDPILTIVSLVKRLQKSLTHAVDQLNYFIAKLRAEDEETHDNGEQDPMQILIETNPHLSKFDPNSDTSHMDFETLEWHKNVMDQIEQIKFGLRRVREMKDQYSSMDVTQHATTLLSNVSMISLSTHQEILDVIRECELSFSFRMAPARNQVVVEHENLVEACTTLQVYLQQPGRTQVAMAFSTLGAMDIVPKPMAKLVSITEKIATQVANLTSSEPNFREVLLLIFKNLPPKWIRCVDFFPPKLVHAVLTYPQGSTVDYTAAGQILQEAKQHAPPDLVRYLDECTPKLIHKLLTVHNVEDGRPELEAVVAKVRKKFKQDVAKKLQEPADEGAAPQDIAGAFIMARKVYTSAMNASQMISGGSLPADGAGGDMLGTVVQMICEYLKGYLCEELGTDFGITIPDELPSDFVALHEFALHTFIEIVTALAKKHNLPLQNSDALRGFATTRKMNPEDIVKCVLQKLPPDLQQCAEGVPVDLIVCALTFPEPCSIEILMDQVAKHAPPAVKTQLDGCSAELVGKLFTAGPLQELDPELIKFAIGWLPPDAQTHCTAEHELIASAKEALFWGLMQTLLNYASRRAIVPPEVHRHLQHVPSSLLYRLLTADSVVQIQPELEQLESNYISMLVEIMDKATPQLKVLAEQLAEGKLSDEQYKRERLLVKSEVCKELDPSCWVGKNAAAMSHHELIALIPEKVDRALGMLEMADEAESSGIVSGENGV